MAEPTPVSLRTASAQSDAAPLDVAERVRREQELADLIEAMRPAVHADGGDIELLGGRRGVRDRPSAADGSVRVVLDQHPDPLGRPGQGPKGAP